MCGVTGTPASMHFATAMAERLPDPQCSTTGRPSTGNARGSNVDSGNSSAPWMRSVTYSCGSRTSISTIVWLCKALCTSVGVSSCSCAFGFIIGSCFVNMIAAIGGGIDLSQCAPPQRAPRFNKYGCSSLLPARRAGRRIGFSPAGRLLAHGVRLAEDLEQRFQDAPRRRAGDRIPDDLAVAPRAHQPVAPQQRRDAATRWSHAGRGRRRGRPPTARPRSTGRGSAADGGCRASEATRSPGRPPPPCGQDRSSSHAFSYLHIYDNTNILSSS